MERLKSMKEQLMTAAQSQMGNLQNVDAKELGEVVDMIKDLEEAIYYCTITKAMNEKDEEKGREHHYYTERVLYPKQMDYNYGGEEYYYPKDRYYRDMDRGYGRMYYTETSTTSSNGRNSSSMGENTGSRNYIEKPMMDLDGMRDSREGRSPISRRTYMEPKAMHKDKASSLKDLENYVNELGKDIIEMIEDSSPEEKQYLEKKISQLATKIGQVNNV